MRYDPLLFQFIVGFWDFDYFPYRTVCIRDGKRAGLVRPGNIFGKFKPENKSGRENCSPANRTGKFWPGPVQATAISILQRVYIQGDIGSGL